MTQDHTGREIRRLGGLRGWSCEIEVIPHFSGERLRLWRLFDRQGREPVGFAGEADDDATLNYLRGEAR